MVWMEGTPEKLLNLALGFVEVASELDQDHLINGDVIFQLQSSPLLQK